MFDNKDALVRFMKDKGADKIFFKCLAENDNSKNQIYLSGSFETLNQIPFGKVVPSGVGVKKQNFKAALCFYWISDEGVLAKAPGAQLILYPKYPEVRLSGFLHACSSAPRAYFKAISGADRNHNNGKDGRVLVIGICRDNRILAYLVPPETALSGELASIAKEAKGLVAIEESILLATTAELLSKIREIQSKDWIAGCQMKADGVIVEYNSRNGGGYTLESCFDIISNGRPEPDWQGWELKAFAGSKITLMTPEPDGGYYGDEKVRGFVKKYGRQRANGDIYFTGVHRCGIQHSTTGMKMMLHGYDHKANKIDEVNGGVLLVDSNGDIAAMWTFAKLIEHWGQKHSHAVYVPYKAHNLSGKRLYKYKNPILLCEGANFNKFLQAFSSGAIYYDPASVIYQKDNRVKPRNQFRISPGKLERLYEGFSKTQVQPGS